MGNAALDRLIDRVRHACATKKALDIRGGGTKFFYGEVPRGEALDVRDLAGIASYEPSELVITARGGTSLAELEATLAEKGQCLAFEPPHFEGDATVGGMVAAGLSGPARVSSGGLRDYVLGATLLNGRGEVLNFGGQVMKNVAGYDVSRLLAGSLGIFGVICEASLKVTPKAATTTTLRFQMTQADALSALNQWAGRPLPMNASSWHDGLLTVRLSGATAAVAAAARTLGGDTVSCDDAERAWLDLKNHHNAFFSAARESKSGAALWRLSVRSTAEPLELSGTQLVEWGGALRWLVTAEPASRIRSFAKRAGGHATLFRRHEGATGVFAPLEPPLERIHRKLKEAFDPDHIFNPGRLYPGL